MRDYAKISPQFWIGKTGREIKSLGIETQLIALYLLSCPHSTMLGVYYLPITLIAHEVGISTEVALHGLKNLIEVGFCSYDWQMEYIWVHEMALFQISSALKPNDNRVRAIHEAIETLPQLSFIENFYKRYGKLFFLTTSPSFARPFEGPPEPLRSQEQEQEQEKEQEQEQAQEGSAPQSDASTILKPIDAFITLPLADNSEYPIHEKQVLEWQQLYPAVDVMQVLRIIRGWNLANPKRRKTQSGILKHVTNWLAKEQNKHHSPQTKQLPPSSIPLFTHNQTVADEWLSKNNKNIVEGEIEHAPQ